MAEYAGPGAALKGHGFSVVTRESTDTEVIVSMARRRTNVRLVITKGHNAGWTATVTGTRATAPVTIENDLDALEQRISK